MRATTTASSAPATVRSTTPPAVFARDPRRSIWPCRPTPSPPIPKSRSAKARQPASGTFKPSRRITSSGSHHERTLRLQAESPSLAVVRTATADFEPHAFFVRGLSDAAQPELLVDLRRHPLLHAGFANPDRRDFGDALHPGGGDGVSLGRADHARRQLRLAVALHARQRRVDVLLRCLCPHVPRPLLWIV